MSATTNVCSQHFLPTSRAVAGRTEHPQRTSGRSGDSAICEPLRLLLFFVDDREFFCTINKPANCLRISRPIASSGPYDVLDTKYR